MLHEIAFNLNHHQYRRAEFYCELVREQFGNELSEEQKVELRLNRARSIMHTGRLREAESELSELITHHYRNENFVVSICKEYAKVVGYQKHE